MKFLEANDADELIGVFPNIPTSRETPFTMERICSVLGFEGWMRSIFISDRQANSIGKLEKGKHFNRVLALVFFSLTFFCITYGYYGGYFLSAVLGLGAFVLTPLTAYLDWRGYHGTARLFLIFSANLYILSVKVGISPGINSEIWYFSLCLICLFYFDYNQTRQITLGIFISTACWLLTIPLSPEIIPLHWRNFSGTSPRWNDVNSFANLIFNLICLRQIHISKQRYRDYSFLKSKFSTLGELTAGIAHETNTCLAVLHSKLNILKIRLKQNQEQEIDWPKEIETLDKYTQQTVRIISGIRSYARQNEGEPMENSSLSDIFENVFDLTRMHLSQKQIAIKIEKIPEDLKILARPHQIVQVLLNLINNSVEAIQKTPDPWIHIEFQIEEKLIRICVRDSGKGIPPEIVSKMMNPYFSNKPFSQGCGLGLCISHRIIEEHRGSLEYTDKRGNTEFQISLSRWE